MDKIEETDWSKRLLPGQFKMVDALTEAIRKACDAYRDEAYKCDWPEDDQKALNVPEWKGRGWR